MYVLYVLYVLYHEQYCAICTTSAYLLCSTMCCMYYNVCMCCMSNCTCLLVGPRQKELVLHQDCPLWRESLSTMAGWLWETNCFCSYVTCCGKWWGSFPWPLPPPQTSSSSNKRLVHLRSWVSSSSLSWWTCTRCRYARTHTLYHCRPLHILHTYVGMRMMYLSHIGVEWLWPLPEGRPL